MPLTRRNLLLSSAAAGATIAALPGSAIAAAPDRPLRTDPFTLGVASGDPADDGFVLWTRLAPEPLADDGLGGMPSRPFPVQWELATDERFRQVIRRGTTLARPESAHSLHIELDGLPAGREFFYRFRADHYLSQVGRTLTAPSPRTLQAQLRMGFVSCAQYEHGYFTAYRRLAEEHPDLILHLGDYQYEHRKGDYVAPGGNVRDHDGPETETLANYRQRYAQYRTDADLQAAHGWRTSTCSTPGSTGTTSCAATASGTARRRSTRPAPSWAPSRRSGSSTGSTARRHAGTSSASRCSSPSRTGTPVRAR
jgi:alkaline phosphatase D